MIYSKKENIKILDNSYFKEEYKNLNISKENRKNLFYKIILFINFIILIIFININNSNHKNKLNKEMKMIEKYYELCKYGILLNEQKFERIFNPRISIISTVYNQEKYILKFLRSIQNQFFDNIEIILVDDFSIDKSVQIIETIQKEDEIIIIIKQNENKGKLISRNDGILQAKGEYIL